jgi:transcriptional repressor NrdR
MKCPFCGTEDSQVKDSRSSEDGTTIRRRRFCSHCNSRFTTFERVQLRELTVIKKNGERRPFDREKIIRSIAMAVRKRSISEEQVEQIANDIVRDLETNGDNEISTSLIGEMIMKTLAKLDKVAYVRFASVYKDFREPEDFAKLIEQLKLPRKT